MLEGEKKQPNTTVAIRFVQVKTDTCKQKTAVTPAFADPGMN
jgi:hypothetical protein